MVLSFAPPSVKQALEARDEAASYQCVQMFDCDGDRRDYAKKQARKEGSLRGGACGSEGGLESRSRQECGGASKEGQAAGWDSARACSGSAQLHDSGLAGQPGMEASQHPVATLPDALCPQWEGFVARGGVPERKAAAASEADGGAVTVEGAGPQ